MGPQGPPGPPGAAGGSDRPGFGLTTLDGPSNVGRYSSIIIGTDGLGLISYHDNGLGDLKVAHCSNIACSAATTATIDNVGFTTGQDTSITIGADGLGLISYHDGFPNSDLKVAHCSNTACNAAATATIDSVSSVSDVTSITIGADGLGLISYFDGAPNFDLKVAHCSDTACSAATTATIDPGPGLSGLMSSTTVGADGLGLISYHDGDLKVAHCSNALCSAATTATLDSVGNTGQYTSITIGADALGVVSYHDSTTGDLKVAHCSNTACGAATTATLDSVGVVGQFTSMTIGTDGLGLISYHDQTNGDLKAAHCSNRLCVPYHRSR